MGLSRFKENSTQIPYTTLIYGNGPGNHQPRRDPTLGPNSTDSPYYVQYAAIHQEEAFHDGSDVAIFASGPYSHLFQGVQEQSYIAHVFSYSMCIGDYTNQPHCRQTSQPPNEQFNGASNSLGGGDQASDSSRRAMVINNPSLGRGFHADDANAFRNSLGSSNHPSKSSTSSSLVPTSLLSTSTTMLIVSLSTVAINRLARLPA